MITAQSGSWRFKVLVVAVATAIALTNVSATSASTSWGKWTLGKHSWKNAFGGNVSLTLSGTKRNADVYAKSTFFGSAQAAAYITSVSGPRKLTKQFKADRLCWSNPSNIDYQLATFGNGFNLEAVWVGFEISEIGIGFDVIQLNGSRDIVIGTANGGTEFHSSPSVIVSQANIGVSTELLSFVKRGQTPWRKLPQQIGCVYIVDPSKAFSRKTVLLNAGTSYKFRMRVVARVNTSYGEASTRMRWVGDSPLVGNFFFKDASGATLAP
jgi:hypothetical protein